ncbi:MAG: YdcF family protein [Alphaproteobacteria bacterium]
MTGQAKNIQRPRTRRLLWAVAALTGLSFAAWLAGLAWFTTLLPTHAEDTNHRTDVIVVLTGGSGRITTGLDLLAAGRAQKLFVSGVGPSVDLQELLRVSQRPLAELECCVVLGHRAGSTLGNAVETAEWMRDNGLRSLRLVTAAYHMPRSLLQFRRAMPDLEIIPHPVFSGRFRQGDWWRWPGSANLIVTEYSKYLVALAYNRRTGR